MTPPNKTQPLPLGDAEQSGAGPVECLGMTFASDTARREHFTERLRERLQDPAFRNIEGFPTGTDADILRLSDPPYYTACPNPFLAEFIKAYGRPYNPSEMYHREPFAADVSEGKNNPIYDAHSYHTKVPHRAIMRYILRYTSAGDIVFDGFCGTGMTGVASAMCSDKSEIESLGYTVKNNTVFDESGQVVSTTGHRLAVLNDLSPISTFIARNLIYPMGNSDFLTEANKILLAVQSEIDWVYETVHASGGDERVKGKISYIVWSDLFICSQCRREILAWEVVIDRENKEMRDKFNCPHCNALLNQRTIERVMETTFDPILGVSYKHTKQEMAMIYYTVEKKRFAKKPDAHDYEIHNKCISKLQEINVQPVQTYSFEHTSRHLKDANHIRGITHSHHYYTPRNFFVLTTFLKHIASSSEYHQMLFVFTGFIDGHANRRNRYILDKNHPKGTTCGPLTNTLFVPELQSEVNLLNVWQKTVKKQSKAKKSTGISNTMVEVRSSTSLSLPDNIIDYIFIDPPFGKNILYSDLNLLWESWLKVRTNFLEEVIINDKQKKAIAEYVELMKQCFNEFYRILKPGRWMTIEFHNSLNIVWSGMQEALSSAGFIVADVRVLDKKHGTIHQDSGYTVKKDLIVSVYKPASLLEDGFSLKKGTEDGVWEFTRAHLGKLPICVSAHDKIEVVMERIPYFLYDRMVAFHVQRGSTVPLSAVEYLAGLKQKFAKRDGMYFLPEQVADYDRKRMTVREVLQLELIITGEKSAIEWLRQQLTRKPQTFQQLHPQFIREIGGWQKFEQPLELSNLLKQSFLNYEPDHAIPPQIVGWMRQSTELRQIIKDEITAGHAVEDDNGLTTQHPHLLSAAKDRWYVPDPNRAQDLEKLRERALLEEFAEYVAFKGRKLKVFRLEAVRAGFKRAWQLRSDQGYRTIVTVANKISEDVLYEDQILLTFYDNARTRLGDNL